MLDYQIYPLKYTPTNLLVRYWSELYEADLLRLRFPAIVDPSLVDVSTVLSKHHEYTHFVIRTDPFEIAGEFTISDHFGKAGLVHFSVSPNNSFKESLFLVRSVTDRVLTEWEQSGKPGEPYVTSLIGLTPSLNRRACLFITKAGFNRVAVLPEATHYEGSVCDALMTIKTRKEVDNGIR
jgi:hypothetical protein